MNRKRILVIDDEPSITRGIKLNLEALGTFEIRQVNQAPDAVQSALEFKPDLILLDVMMPEMDGGEVAARLREIPSLKDTPIIFLTAIVAHEETQGGEAYIGGEDYLAKPVDLGTLVQAIQHRLIE
ncbi:MAG: response regulator [Verrucomicrobia bacterium]|nr:response regulator [Verrucomicrobiota bacterium]